jgi:hypothetical protein
MRTTATYTFTILILTLTSLAGWTQSCDSLEGRWINQDSSIMHIMSESNGMLTGTYQSNASRDSRLFPFAGHVNRQGEFPTLSFAVSWAEYGSMTSWTGYCREKQGLSTLMTMWHLVRPYVDEDWERFVTNTSTFTPSRP